MKVAYIATGAANMYCGSCMRDNTLVAAMKTMGHDVVMLPMYTPLRVDEESVSEKHVFYGGIEAYLLQKFPHPSPWRSFLLRLAGAQALVRLLPRFDIGSAVDPAANAEMTISMLRGETGYQHSLLAEMTDWLATTLRPDMVHITNTLISGIAPTLKKRLNVPLVCGLHGEDIFIDGLPPAYRQEALALIEANAAHIDHFIAISQYYADYYGRLANIDPAKITLVRPGIALADYHRFQADMPQPETVDRSLTIGYLARISPEKGLHLLAEAFILLAESGEFPNLRLEAAGYLSKAHHGYVRQIEQRLAQAGLTERAAIIGTVERQQKLDFLHRIDLFALPTIYRDPKGLPLLEALASGTAVVVPKHGAFPELVAETGGGLLHEPENPVDLATTLAHLLRDKGQRQALGQQGQMAVNTHFHAVRMAAETNHVYQQVTANGTVSII